MTTGRFSVNHERDLSPLLNVVMSEVTIVKGVYVRAGEGKYILIMTNFYKEKPLR